MQRKWKCFIFITRPLVARCPEFDFWVVHEIWPLSLMRLMKSHFNMRNVQNKKKLNFWMWNAIFFGNVVMDGCDSVILPKKKKILSNCFIIITILIIKCMHNKLIYFKFSIFSLGVRLAAVLQTNAAAGLHSTGSGRSSGRRCSRPHAWAT